MCYKCQVCFAVSEPGQARLLYTIHRYRPMTRHLEIACEIPVCRECSGRLKAGVTLGALLLEYQGPQVSRPVLRPISPPSRAPAPRPAVSASQRRASDLPRPQPRTQVIKDGDTVLSDPSPNLGRPLIWRKPKG